MDYDVLEARHVREHIIWLRFRDGTSGEIDLAPVLNGPVFEPHKNVDYFRRFRLDPRWHTLTWPNDTDVAPEYLHAHITSARESTATL